MALSPSLFDDVLSFFNLTQEVWRANFFSKSSDDLFAEFSAFLGRYCRRKSTAAAAEGRSNSSSLLHGEVRTDDNLSAESLKLRFNIQYAGFSNEGFSFQDFNEQLRLINDSCEGSSSDHAVEKNPQKKQLFHEIMEILWLYTIFKQRQDFEKYRMLIQSRESLPIHRKRDSLIDALKRHRVLLIVGDTGCGKSTQVPQYLLKSGLFNRIVCTQPRRIAAINISKRLEFEWSLWGSSDDIGYQVRFDAKRSANAKIVFVTEGLLLRYFEGDSRLSDFDCVIIDEVHERHASTDLLLGVLYALLKLREDLKLVLMSATSDVESFMRFFNLSGDAILFVKGRKFDVDLFYRPQPGDEQLVLIKNEAIIHKKRSSGLEFNPWPYLRVLDEIDRMCEADEGGDVLIFLRGAYEIHSLVEAINENLNSSGKWVVLPLYSQLSSEEQEAVFMVPPLGKRKCIVSTNIAETSVTIDGIRFVIDSGKYNEMDVEFRSSLHQISEKWISKSMAIQRMGRAGRTGPGVCFRLYPEMLYKQFEDQAAAEVLRVPLDSHLLRILALGLQPRDFQHITRPPSSSISHAIFSLLSAKAINEAEDASCEETGKLGASLVQESIFDKSDGTDSSAVELERNPRGLYVLTPLGRFLSRLPLELKVAKMVLISLVFNLVQPIVVCAASLSFQGLSDQSKRLRMNSRRGAEQNFGSTDFGSKIPSSKLWDGKTDEASSGYRWRSSSNETKSSFESVPYLADGDLLSNLKIYCFWMSSRMENLNSESSWQRKLLRKWLDECFIDEFRLFELNKLSCQLLRNIISHSEDKVGSSKYCYSADEEGESLNHAGIQKDGEEKKFFLKPTHDASVEKTPTKKKISVIKQRFGLIKRSEEEGESSFMNESLKTERSFKDALDGAGSNVDRIGLQSSSEMPVKQKKKSFSPTELLNEDDIDSMSTEIEQKIEPTSSSSMKSQPIAKALLKLSSDRGFFDLSSHFRKLKILKNSKSQHSPEKRRKRNEEGRFYRPRNSMSFLESKTMSTDRHEADEYDSQHRSQKAKYKERKDREKGEFAEKTSLTGESYSHGRDLRSPVDTLHLMDSSKELRLPSSPSSTEKDEEDYIENKQLFNSPTNRKNAKSEENSVKSQRSELRRRNSKRRRDSSDFEDAIDDENFNDQGIRTQHAEAIRSFSVIFRSQNLRKNSFWALFPDVYSHTLLKRNPTNTFSPQECFFTLISFIISYSLYPNVAVLNKAASHSTLFSNAIEEQRISSGGRILSSSQELLFQTRYVDFVSLHPSSGYYRNFTDGRGNRTVTEAVMNTRIKSPPFCLVYGGLIQTTKPYITNVTSVKMLPLLLLASKRIDTNYIFNMLIIDEWIQIRGNPKDLLDCICKSYSLRWNLQARVDLMIESIFQAGFSGYSKGSSVKIIGDEAHEMRKRQDFFESLNDELWSCNDAESILVLSKILPLELMELIVQPPPKLLHSEFLTGILDLLHTEVDYKFQLLRSSEYTAFLRSAPENTTAEPFSSAPIFRVVQDNIPTLGSFPDLRKENCQTLNPSDPIKLMAPNKEGATCSPEENLGIKDNKYFVRIGPFLYFNTLLNDLDPNDIRVSDRLLVSYMCETCSKKFYFNRIDISIHKSNCRDASVPSPE